jgi:virginiamycin B lyase
MRAKALIILFSLLTGLAWAGLTAVRPATTSSAADDAASFIYEYPIPAAVGSAPLNIVVQSPGRIWFTMPNANAIGSLVVTSTADYKFTRYTLPNANSEPYDIAYANNTIWFTQRAGNRIGRLNTLTGQITNEYPVTTANSAPTGIDVAPDGQVWFVQRTGNKFARLNPDTGVITEFIYGVPNAHFEQLRVQNNNVIWATAPNLDRIVAWEWVGNEVELFTVGTGSGSRPYGIAMGGGVPWITASGSNLIGRYMPGTLTLWRWYAPGTANSNLAGIAFQSASGVNRAWFAQRDVNRVGMIETDSIGRAYLIWDQPLPAANSQPHGVAVDATGSVWITAVGNARIIEWRSPYLDLEKIYLPMVSRS